MLPGTGNSVAEIHEITTECVACCGTGRVNRDKVYYIANRWGLEFSAILDCFRQIEEYGEADCPICEGQGFTEVVF